MVRWLKKLFGIVGAAAAATISVAQAQPTEGWSGYIEAARDLSGDDREIGTLLALASEDTDALEAALKAPPYNGTDWFIQYTPGSSPPGSLFRDAMMAKGLLAYLDWKEGADEIFGHYDNQMRRLSLPMLTSAHRAEMEAREPSIPNEDRLYFTDYVEALDGDAIAKNHRVLVFDENADSYAFLVVTPAQFNRWHETRLGPDHRFFSANAFVTDQTR